MVGEIPTETLAVTSGLIHYPGYRREQRGCCWVTYCPLLTPRWGWLAIWNRTPRCGWGLPAGTAFVRTGVVLTVPAGLQPQQTPTRRSTSACVYLLYPCGERRQGSYLLVLWRASTLDVPCCPRDSNTPEYAQLSLDKRLLQAPAKRKSAEI